MFDLMFLSLFIAVLTLSNKPVKSEWDPMSFNTTFKCNRTEYSYYISFFDDRHRSYIKYFVNNYRDRGHAGKTNIILQGGWNPSDEFRYFNHYYKIAAKICNDCKGYYDVFTLYFKQKCETGKYCKVKFETDLNKYGGRNHYDLDVEVENLNEE